MLRLTSSGSVSDYTDSDRSSLKQNVANVAGVDRSFVTIQVTAASVIITATIAVPASMTADKVQSSLAARFDTANAASTALGITVVSKPSVVIHDDGGHPVVGRSDDGVPSIIIVPVAVIVIGACVLGGACLARFMVRRRKQQPLGTATRVETPNAEAGFEMHGTDKGDFKLGSGRPAEDHYGIVPGPL